MNTPKEDRDEAFYFGFFTEMTTWSKQMWEDELASHHITEGEDEQFSATAERLWAVYSEEEKAEFKSTLDDWLDS